MEKLTKEMEDMLNLSLEKFETLTILYHNQKWRGVVNNSYYSCYDLMKVALLNKGIKTVTHEGVQSLITGKFVRNNEMPKYSAKKFNKLMELRHLADYNPQIEVHKGVANEACQLQVYLQVHLLAHLKTKFESVLFNKFDDFFKDLEQKINPIQNKHKI